VRDGGPGELTGIAAAAGVVRGRARVLRSSRELGALAPGEVIVCEATTPSWTPAFATAAACVCDQGGSLTHAAIVSREYGIPCVTGTVRATSAIATGDVVEVDGRAGRVRVLERGSSG
jgi:phosphoenolpyruvate synthase/pyruvate phosphate dikinase